MPIAISPHDHNKVYVASQVVHQTTDGGQSWQVMSPDLTRNDKTKQHSSGGLTPDNSGAGYEAIVSLIESPIEKGLIWAGTNDGQVQVTRDAGKTWTNVSKNLPHLPAWGWVGSIDPSRYDAGTAYITIDFHHVNNRDPFVFTTNDYGKSWKAIVNGLPHGVLAYTHCIKADPLRRGLLYVGTESGMYVSFDDGESWQPLQMNLPHAPVYGIAVQQHFNDLVIATYGRGIWILDDLAPIQQLTPQVMSADAHLFAPRPAYRFRQITAQAVVRESEPGIGFDPPYGASINYYLKSPSSTPVTVRILDHQGQVIRTLTGTNVAGVNRINWNLRGEPTREFQLRTSPLYAPDITSAPEGWRRAPDAGRFSLLSPPGRYTVKLSASGRELSQPLVVLKDPHSGASEEEIKAQMTMLLELRRDIERAADVVNEIELARSQIDRLGRTVEDVSIRKAGDELTQKLIAVEQNLTELRLTGRAGRSWGSKLAAKLFYLANELASNDFRPTNQQAEVQKLLEQRLATHRRQLEALRTKDIAAFNDLLRQRNVPHIITSTPEAAGWDDRRQR